MKLPKKCGDMYVMFDEKNQPDYGFICEYNNIKKFVNFKDKQPEYIVLPKLNEKRFDLIPQSEEETNIANLGYYADLYLKGIMRISPKAFKGIDKANIVIPFDTSVMLDWECFDDNSYIKFLIPDTMDLKQVNRMFDTGFDYERENWTLIADKRLHGYGDISGDSYSVGNYEKSSNYVNYTVNYIQYEEYLKAHPEEDISESETTTDTTDDLSM